MTKEIDVFEDFKDALAASGSCCRQTGLTLDADTIREICNSGVDIVCHCVKAGDRFTLEEVHLTF